VAPDPVVAPECSSCAAVQRKTGSTHCWSAPSSGPPAPGSCPTRHHGEGKLDSRKKANIPSMASVVPTTPPAYWLKRAQLVPNWNSMGMPVTTPTAKLRPKTRTQNRAPASQAGSSVRSAFHLKITMRSASPVVSCGNR